ncbi:MAG: hypothetical protein LQ339_002348 [Xanthoria mediterranea]|nr:MAG: hypothetical protein LQ339_002348 [Xanthoria mediterranea]
MSTTRRYSTQTSRFTHSSEASDRQHSHSSSANMNPSSALLQDLLRERKASQRASRISENDNASYERQVQSSPIGPSAASKTHARKTSGLTVPKEMGLREMEEYVSKLNKQNFDLKLEIFQRRQRSDALEEKAAKLDEVEIHNDELRQLNDDLLLELEKRDAAVGEAVTLICELEAKVVRLENEQQHNRRPVTPIENHYANTKTLDINQLLAPTSTARPPSSIKSSEANFAARQNCVISLGRERQHEEDRLLHSPSFLSDDKPSTSALRGLFLSHDKDSIAHGFGPKKPSLLSLSRVGSPFSQDDFPDTLDEDAFSLNPRRLSLLSESSFVSFHGQKKEKITTSGVPKGTLNASPPNGDASAVGKLSQEGKVQQWIEHRDHPATPSRPSTNHARPDEFSSIGAMLRSDRPSDKEVPHPTSPKRSRGRPQPQNLQQPGKADKKSSFAAPIFGPDALPPTPGTMSSATLGGRSSNHSIIAEKSLNNGVPRPTTGHNSDASHGRSLGSNDELQSTQDDHVKAEFPPTFDNDTDFDGLDEDKHPAYRNMFMQPNHHLNGNPRATPLMGKSTKASQVLGANGSRRPRLNNHITNPMFNGEGFETTRHSRTISYPSPGRRHQDIDQIVTNSPKQAMVGSNGGLESSTQQASTAKPSLPRSLSSYSKPSQSTAPAPPQTFASRFFRRTPSSTTPASTQPETNMSPEPKVRPPRPTSLYARTTSNPPPPSLAAPMKVPRPARPGTSDMATLNPRRFSGGFSSLVGRKSDEIAAGHFGAANGEQQQQQQQVAPPPQPQSKRLSVGAIGRSASLRIKEGFGRKK